MQPRLTSSQIGEGWAVHARRGLPTEGERRLGPVHALADLRHRPRPWAPTKRPDTATSAASATTTRSQPRQARPAPRAPRPSRARLPVPGFWTNFQPDDNHGTFDGPPSYPHDSRGTSSLPRRTAVPIRTSPVSSRTATATADDYPVRPRASRPRRALPPSKRASRVRRAPMPSRRPSTPSTSGTSTHSTMSTAGRSTSARTPRPIPGVVDPTNPATPIDPIDPTNPAARSTRSTRPTATPSRPAMPATPHRGTAVSATPSEPVNERGIDAHLVRRGRCGIRSRASRASRTGPGTHSRAMPVRSTHHLEMRWLLLCLTALVALTGCADVTAGQEPRVSGRPDVSTGVRRSDGYWDLWERDGEAVPAGCPLAVASRRDRCAGGPDQADGVRPDATAQTI